MDASENNIACKLMHQNRIEWATLLSLNVVFVFIVANKWADTCGTTDDKNTCL